MKDLLRSLIKLTPLYPPIYRYRLHKRERAIIAEWRAQGSPLPPPHELKRHVLRDYGRRFGLKILVETGTNEGVMIDACKAFFAELHTIELSPELHARAKARFQKDKHVRLIFGDSAQEMPGVLRQLTGPALFWLDGHYSAGNTAKGEKDTPIVEELHHIFSEARLAGSVILIDDARCFMPGEWRDPAYPTIEELVEEIRKHGHEVSIAVEEDIIRITPGTSDLVAHP